MAQLQRRQDPEVTEPPRIKLPIGTLDEFMAAEIVLLQADARKALV